MSQISSSQISASPLVSDFIDIDSSQAIGDDASEVTITPSRTPARANTGIAPPSSFAIHKKGDRRALIWKAGHQEEWKVWHAATVDEWLSNLRNPTDEDRRRANKWKKFRWHNRGGNRDDSDTVYTDFHHAADMQKGTPVVVCQICNAFLSHPRVGGSSTSTLKNHSATHGPNRGGSILSYCTSQSGSKDGVVATPYTPEAFREQLLRVIISGHLSFRSVENKELKKLVLMLNKDARLPGRTAIRSQLDNIYQSLETKILAGLPPGAKVSIALDAWQSQFKKSYLAITAHYISKDWQLVEELIGFEHLTMSHTGAVMAEVVDKVLERYKISDRLFCVTSDNASSNDTLLSSLEVLLLNKNIEWCANTAKIPCLAHVIQLVVKAFFTGLNVKSASEVEADEAPARNTRADTAAPPDSRHAIASTIESVRALSTLANRSSGVTDALLLEQEDGTTGEALRLKRDIAIRWNSTFDMLLRFLRLRASVVPWHDKLCAKRATLEKHRMTEESWKHIRYVLHVLRPFAEMTGEVGAGTDTTINFTFAIYNLLFDHIEEIEQKLARKSQAAWMQVFQPALENAKAKLSEYYTKTGGGAEKVYSAAVLLDPIRKDQAFRESRTWEPQYRKIYIDELTTTWRNNYRERGGLSTLSCDSNSTSPPNTSRSLNQRFRPDVTERSVRSKHQTELDQYMKSDQRHIKKEGALQHWKEIEGNFPTVAMMARDVLAVPASGTGVERVFSIARNIHNFHRAHLKPETVMKLMITNHYLRISTLEEAEAEAEPDPWNDQRQGLLQSDTHLVGERRITALPDTEILKQCVISDDDDCESDEDIYGTTRRSTRGQKRPARLELDGDSVRRRRES